MVVAMTDAMSEKDRYKAAWDFLAAQDETLFRAERGWLMTGWPRCARCPTPLEAVEAKMLALAAWEGTSAQWDEWCDSQPNPNAA
jgi:hypothetical protein